MAGFECDFVEPPPKIFVAECPICLHVLREPYQATCCGKNFCKACLEEIKESKKPCPCCKTKQFSDFEDKRMQQTLYDFKVYCIHKSKGCEWMGELRVLDEHLNANPSAKSALEGCQFTVINCPLSYGGCEVQLPRQDMPIHLSESAVSHMLLQAEQQTLLLDTTTVLESENANLREELENKAEYMDDLDDELSELRSRVSELEGELAEISRHQKLAQTTALPIGPVDFTVDNFEKKKQDNARWWSAPFYTHPQGYKMVLRIDACGWGEGKGTHVSLAVYIKEGEFDQTLKWPFRGIVTVQLLSQVKHENMEKCFNFLTQSTEKAMKGVGSATFISHSDLASKQYLNDDSLVFRISKIELK